MSPTQWDYVCVRWLENLIQMHLFAFYLANDAIEQKNTRVQMSKEEKKKSVILPKSKITIEHFGYGCFDQYVTRYRCSMCTYYRQTVHKQILMSHAHYTQKSTYRGASVKLISYNLREMATAESLPKQSCMKSFPW